MLIPVVMRATLFLALSLCLLLSAPARAANVTVGGITYDIQFDVGASFDDNSALIQASPWWGNATDADAFATAYRDQVPTPYPFDRTTGTEFLFFSYVTVGITNDARSLNDGGGLSTFTGRDNSTAFFNAFYAYSAGVVPVPEIDGGALGQGAVILLALWLMLRRRGGVA